MIRRLLILVSLLLIVLVSQVDSQINGVEIIQDDRTGGPILKEEESMSPEEPGETTELEPQTEPNELEETSKPSAEPGPEQTAEPGPEPQPKPEPKPEAKKATKFFCDSVEKADSLKSIVRAFRDQNDIYLLSRHRAFKFHIFDVHDKAGRRNYGNENQLVIREPYARPQESVEEMEGQSVYGYAYVNGYSRNDTRYRTINYEVHLKRSELYLGDVYELNFDKDWGERGKKADIYNDHWILYHFLRYVKPSARGWYYGQWFDLPSAIIEFSNSWEGGQNPEQYLNTKICHWHWAKYKCKAMKQNLHERLKFFVPFTVSTDTDWTTHFFNIDDKNQLHIKRSIYTLTYPLTSDELRFPPIPIDEFFSCHRDPINERELKGVWFDKNSGTFYLFINRFYRKIQDDMIEKEFKISGKGTYDSLRFDQESVEFEIMSTVWVKTVGDAAYLVTSASNVFVLNTERLADRLQTDNSNLVDRCTKQTLLIEGEVFCFGETDYYHMVSQENMTHPNKTTFETLNIHRERVVHRIGEIFLNTGIEYSDNQQLKFIFNYQKNQFVFATKTNLFLFDYEKFSVDMAAKKVLTKYTAEDKIEIKTNCLLDPYKPNCGKKGILTTPSQVTELITTAPPDVIRANMDMLIISFLVLILVLIVLTFFIVRAIQAKKRPMIKYNLYVKGIDGLSRIGSSFASRIFKKKSGIELAPEAPAVSSKGGKAKSVTGDSVSVISSANLTVGSRKSAKSVNYSNPKSRTSSPNKRNKETPDVAKKRRQPE